MRGAGRGVRRPGLPLAPVVLALAALAGTGCELTEVTLAEPRDAVVVEGLVQLRPLTGPGPSDASYVFLHRTLDATGASGPVPGASVTIRREDGELLTLDPTLDPGLCATDEEGEPGPGTCYGPVLDRGIRPGERLALRVELPDGGVVTGVTTVPERIALDPVASAVGCALPPLETFDVVWNRAEGAWAYVAETRIRGLGPYFDTLGVELEDPLKLVGLAVSAADTTIVFPSEFGVFERADLEQQVALLLQRGLPEGVDARVAVTAVDRNYVNWVRGGNFNPSGQVRVPSVAGAGTGFFGSAATADMRVEATSRTTGLPPCPGG